MLFPVGFKIVKTKLQWDALLTTQLWRQVSYIISNFFKSFLACPRSRRFYNVVLLLDWAGYFVISWFRNWSAYISSIFGKWMVECHRFCNLISGYELCFKNSFAKILANK